MARSFTFRADTSAYVGFGVISAFTIGISAFIVAQDPKPSSTVTLALCICLGVLITLWLGRFRIDIDDEHLTYTTLTHKRTVRLVDIAAEKLSTEPLTGLWGPTV